jgi:hypothetical protein
LRRFSVRPSSFGLSLSPPPRISALSWRATRRFSIASALPRPPPELFFVVPFFAFAMGILLSRVGSSRPGLRRCRGPRFDSE